MNFEWGRRWKPSPTVCREKAVSHRALLQGHVISECVSSKFFFFFFLTISSLVVCSGQNQQQWECEPCVYSGRAASGHHTCGSTQYNLWYGVVLSHHDCNLIEARPNIGFTLLMLLSCVPGSSRVSCGTVAWLPEVAIDVTARTHSLLDRAVTDSVTTNSAVVTSALKCTDFTFVMYFVIHYRKCFHHFSSPEKSLSFAQGQGAFHLVTSSLRALSHWMGNTH